MKVSFFCEAYENNTNIGIAKAMTEAGLQVEDLREIAMYLLVFAANNPTDQGGEEE